MTTSTLRPVVAAALVLALGVTVLAKTKFSSVWKAPEADGFTLKGKKVATLVIDKDDSLRVSGEEALAHQLVARGVSGLPSYRIVPKEVIGNTDQAKAFLERAGIEGVVAMRVVNDDKRRYYQPATWSSASYTTLWGYYGYGVAAVYDPGYTRDERILSIETLIYDVPKNTLIWAGLATTDNPKDPRQVVAEVVKEAVNEMRKQGLAR